MSQEMKIEKVPNCIKTQNPESLKGRIQKLLLKGKPEHTRNNSSIRSKDPSSKVSVSVILVQRKQPSDSQFIFQTDKKLRHIQENNKPIVDKILNTDSHYYQRIKQIRKRRAAAKVIKSFQL